MEPMRFVVGTRDCDELGHLNVSGYVYYCNRAGMALIEAMGWPPGQANRGRRYSFAAVHMVSDYLAELHEGEEIAVHVGISLIGTKSATFDNTITRADGAVVFRSAWKSALMDLDSRRAVTIPDDLRAAMQPHLTGAG
ncbi:MAG: thioesterase family protein [Rhodobacteraceae bacterium]|nr:thioesterase family protein [Paracoccaceae bacterium]